MTQEHDSTIWFQRSASRWGFYPCTAAGWIAFGSYLMLVSMPFFFIWLLKIKLSGLVIFLLGGHITLFTSIFVAICYLHSKPITTSNHQ